jgi:hypothetical protein
LDADDPADRLRAAVITMPGKSASMTVRRGGCCLSGPDGAANMLEVVVVERDVGSELAIHAMRCARGTSTCFPAGGL